MRRTTGVYNNEGQTTLDRVRSGKQQFNSPVLTRTVGWRDGFKTRVCTRRDGAGYTRKIGDFNNKQQKVTGSRGVRQVERFTGAWGAREAGTAGGRTRPTGYTAWAWWWGRRLPDTWAASDAAPLHPAVSLPPTQQILYNTQSVSCIIGQIIYLVSHIKKSNLVPILYRFIGIYIYMSTYFFY